MKVYHGSKEIIKKPIAHGSKETNDYGPAFYMTKDTEAAKEWACRNDQVGFVNIYEFDIRGLRVLDLRKENPLVWISILMHFRNLEKSFLKAFGNRIEYLDNNYYIDVNQYDVIIGYRADDAYFRFPSDFVRGNITLEQLKKSFELGNLGVQIVIMSERAINRLHFIDAIVPENKYCGQYYSTVQKATEEYDSLSKDEEGIRIFDIIRGNNK